MKCAKCKSTNVDVWTAYYWFHKMGGMCCLNCIYKKPKRKPPMTPVEDGR